MNLDTYTETSLNTKIIPAKPSTDEQYLKSNYNLPIPRKFVEKITGLSTVTLSKYEQEGIVTPIKVKHGGLEVVTYMPSDISKIFKKRGINFNKTGRAEVISVFSQKGGTGKSAFTQHIASILSLLGKTLVIDLDSQADATALFGIDEKYTDILDEDADMEPTVAELMDWTLADGSEPPYQQLKFEQVVKKLSPTLHVVPSDLDISEINYSLNRLKLADKVDADGNVKPQVLNMLKEVIDAVATQYDFIIFDCPPNIETCNVNALFASNRILTVLELEAKCLKTCKRNETFLQRLMDLHPGFNWDKVLIVPNKFKRENIKIKALARLQDIYQDREDIQLSEVVFPNAAIVDKCSEAREPIYLTATKYGKEFKANIPQAKEFTDLYWFLVHEILDLPFDHFIFSNTEEE